MKGDGLATQPVLVSQGSSNAIPAAHTNNLAADDPVKTKARPLAAVSSGQGGAGKLSTASPATSQAALVPPTNPDTVVAQITTNTTDVADDDSGMSYFDRRIAHFLRHVIIGTYLLILLLLLLFLSYRIWRWSHDTERKHR